MLKVNLNQTPRIDETDDSSELTEQDRILLDKIAKKIAYLGLSTPAIFFIEMHKPMNFLGSQLLVFLEPILWGFFNSDEFRRFALILEKRDTLEVLLRRIEELEEDIEEKKRLLKAEKRGKKS
ncbi:MAG TPA: hypothetical protein ENN73_06915 [Firmicutes bacterium]|nr:hypothetical protein [Bacillota bacterium]